MSRIYSFRVGYRSRWNCVCEELNLETVNLRFYTDGKVVLRYINHTSNRFTVYISNRVECIRNFSFSEKSDHLPTNENPANVVTRPIRLLDLLSHFGWPGSNFSSSRTFTIPARRSRTRHENTIVQNNFWRTGLVKFRKVFSQEIIQKGFSHPNPQKVLSIL